MRISHPRSLRQWFANVRPYCPQSGAIFQAHVVARAEPETLPASEFEVLQSLPHGHTYKEIANELGSSLSTVRTYIKLINEKLDVYSQTEPVMKFARKLN